LGKDDEDLLLLPVCARKCQAIFEQKPEGGFDTAETELGLKAVRLIELVGKGYFFTETKILAIESECFDEYVFGLLLKVRIAKDVLHF
jgi:hypothetical protein